MERMRLFMGDSSLKNFSRKVGGWNAAETMLPGEERVRDHQNNAGEGAPEEAGEPQDAQGAHSAEEIWREFLGFG